MENRFTRKQADVGDVEVATFYRFVDLPDCEAVALRLREAAERAEILGTVIVASEGVNATVAGDSTRLRDWVETLRSDPRFASLRPRFSSAARMPFYRLKVKLRDEIVTLGQPGVKPQRRTGVHVDPEQWDKLLADPNIVVIDTRNRYETGVGTFENAIDPGTDSFRQFPDFVNKKLDPSQHPRVAMFCTGGIRCEKASAWMLEQGFEEVFQLDGGILNYLENREAEQGSWRGACFLFDQRVGVDYGLRRSELEICHGCRHPLTAEECRSDDYEAGVSCPHCAAALTDSRRASLRERQRQEELARRAGRRHIGNRPGKNTEESG
ncbi:MAG: rhodanese-related sulfurtransferase [Gammaproteobacteria bacterium]|nr:rhodanese-related sulfurtransferase [Gammaproteobacteria bacterium]